MKGAALATSLLLIGQMIFGQEVVVCGVVIDEHSASPITRSHVVVSPQGNATYTNAKGFFSLNVRRAGSLTVTHVRHETKKVSFDLNVAINDTIWMDIVLAVKTHMLREFTIGTNIDTVYGSPQYSVADFEFMGDKLLMLVYEKRLEKQSEILLANEFGDPIASVIVPNKATELYKDYQDRLYVKCEHHVYEVRCNADNLKLTQVPFKQFYSRLEPCVDSIAESIYFTNYMEEYPGLDYYAFKPLDSTLHNLRHVEDPFMMELFRSEYKYMDIHAQLKAFRAELETGIDREIVAGFMTGFGKSLYYDPLYAPLLVVKDSVLVFDHYTDHIYRYDTGRQLADSVKISYHHQKKPGQWRKELLKDPVSESVYTLYLKNGINHVREIDLQSGELKSDFPLSHKYAEHIKVKDDYVYYIYRPFESLQKKFLYKEPITN